MKFSIWDETCFESVFKPKNEERIQEIFVIFTKLRPSNPQLLSSPLSASESPHVSVSPLPLRHSLAVPRASCHFFFFLLCCRRRRHCHNTYQSHLLSGRIFSLASPSPPPPSSSSFLPLFSLSVPFSAKEGWEPWESKVLETHRIPSHPIFSLSAPFLVTTTPWIGATYKIWMVQN